MRKPLSACSALNFTQIWAMLDVMFPISSYAHHHCLGCSDHFTGCGDRMRRNFTGSGDFTGCGILTGASVHNLSVATSPTSSFVFFARPFFLQDPFFRVQNFRQDRQTKKSTKKSHQTRQRNRNFNFNHVEV